MALATLERLPCSDGDQRAARRTTRERPAVAASHSPGFPWLGLSVVAGAVFVSVTSELLPTGLLPQMAAGLMVSQSQIGLLVAVFATMVVVSAVALTGLTQRFPRKALILVVLVVFAAANFMVAAAEHFEVVVAARVLGGLAQGLFWAVVGAYPGHLLPKKQLARGVAIISAGGSAAFVLGVPLGTALGVAVGWRLAFTVLGVVVLVLTALVWRFLPGVDHRSHADAATAGESVVPSRDGRLWSLRDPSVRLIAVVFVTVFTLMAGHNTVYTYIVPFFTDVNGFPAEWVSGLLLVNGVAGVLGLILVATVWAKHPRAGLVSSIAVVAVAVAALGVLPREQLVVVTALVVWGAAMSAPPALLQTKLLDRVEPGFRDIGAAFMTTGFNLGIATGAALGSGVLELAGLAPLPFVAAAVIGLCLILVVAGELCAVGKSRTDYR